MFLFWERVMKINNFFLGLLKCEWWNIILDIASMQCAAKERFFQSIWQCNVTWQVLLSNRNESTFHVQIEIESMYYFCIINLNIWILAVSAEHAKWDNNCAQLCRSGSTTAVMMGESWSEEHWEDGCTGYQSNVFFGCFIFKQVS